MITFRYPGPQTIYSLHNHTTFSDGASSAEDMCRAAKTAGIKQFGISDHWCIPAYDGTDHESWCMNPADFDKYFETMLALQKKYNDDDFTLNIGLELEFFPENIDEVICSLKNYPLDYLIGSVHYAGVFSIDYDIKDWQGLTQEKIDSICEIYWSKVLLAAKSGYFTFLGHLDLPKKFNLIDEKKYLTHAEKVLDALQQSRGAIELNTSGWFKNCRSPYPSVEILHQAAIRQIPVIINADAHHSDHVKRGFDDAERLLTAAGYTSRI